jgi:hypothetical protein
MTFKNKTLQKFWRFSASFQLGIPIMIAITSLIAAGTFVEAHFNDSGMAKKLVYDSWMMWVTMSLLCYNLLVVVVDRWPWKTNHYPFVTVHFGIIIIVIGGWITGKYGIDGTLAIPIGGQSKLVITPPTDFVVYATYDGDRYAKIYEREVDFFNTNPSEEKPFVARLEDNPAGSESDSHQLKIVKYVPFARVNKKVVAVKDESPEKSSGIGSSIKFQLSNPNVKQLETLTQEKKSKAVQVNLGPLALYLGHDYVKLGRKSKGQNEVYFSALDNDHVEYALFRATDEKPFEKKSISIGAVVQTPWMGLQIKLIDYLPLAKEEWDVKELVRSTPPVTTAAVLVEYRGSKKWLLLNDVIKVFGDTVAFIVSYQNRRIDLGFPIKLADFKVTRYQGAQKAMEYASQVLVGDNNSKFNSAEVVISMNEPLKHAGYTFYQSSFNEDENTGEPIASILSVNKDPGRWIKYLGSLVFCFGIVWLFYQRRKRRIAL